MAKWFRRRDRPVSEGELWWRRAADAGQPEAMFNVGVLAFEQGDVTQAEMWLRKSAEAGFPKAMYLFAFVLDGDGDWTWMCRAAEAGWPEAMSFLAAEANAAGDHEQAAEWTRRAAEAEERGLELFAPEWQRPEPAVQPSAEVVAMAATALGAMRSGDTATAEAWYRRAADAGHAESMFNLGVMSMHRDDREQALVWFRRAAEAGDPDAMSALGSLLSSPPPRNFMRGLPPSAGANTEVDGG